MKETKEQLQKIIDGAPDGATHVDTGGNYYRFNEHECTWMAEHGQEDFTETLGKLWGLRDLSDIRDKLALVEKLTATEHELEEATELANTACEALSQIYDRDEALAICNAACETLSLISDRWTGSEDATEMLETLNDIHDMADEFLRLDASKELQDLRKREQVKGIKCLIDSETSVARVQGNKRALIFCQDASAFVDKIQSGEVTL